MNNDPMNPDAFWSQYRATDNPLAQPPVPMGAAPPSPPPPSPDAGPVSPSPGAGAVGESDFDKLLAKYNNDEKKAREDPEYLAAKAGRDRARSQQEKLVGEQLQSLHEISTAPPPNFSPPLKEAAPEMRNFSVQAIPWLMMMTAIGGKVAGLSGMNMLGAMKGMLKGSQDGQKQAFDEAYTNWQENWKRAQEDWRNRMELYDAQVKWRAGKANAEGLAAQAERELGGAYSDDMKTVVGMHNAQEKFMVSLAALNGKLASHKDAVAAKQSKQLSDDIKAYQKAAASFPRLQAAYGDTDRALSLLPRVLEKYKNDLQNGPNALVPKSFAQYLVATGDTEIQQFSKLLTAAKPIAAALETSNTGSRSNMLLQAMIADTVPNNVLNMGAAEVDMLTRELHGILKSSFQQQKNNIEDWRKKLEMDGFSVTDQPGYEIPPSELPSEKPGATPAPASGGWGKASVVDDK